MKKRFVLLRGKFGNYIVGTRSWYESNGLNKKRGSNQMWWLAAQHNDEAVLKAMAGLTERYVK